MSSIIVTTSEELKAIVSEAVSRVLPEQKDEPVIDTITLTDALELLAQHGFPTSKAKMYKLTSTGKIPCRTYGKKLVFSRKEILQWAESQTKPKHDDSENTLGLARSAKRKMR